MIRREQVIERSSGLAAANATLNARGSSGRHPGCAGQPGQPGVRKTRTTRTLLFEAQGMLSFDRTFAFGVEAR